MAKTGRPSKFTPKMAENILFLSAKGLTELEICQVQGVSEVTFNKWKTSKVFLQALKESKGSIDEQVKRSLLFRALGGEYEQEEVAKKGFDFEIVKLKKYALPDVTACIFWLKNRQPKDWREKHELSIDPNEEQNIKTVIRVFQPSRQQENVVIERGSDPIETLLGKGFVEQVKTNGNHTNGTNGLH